MRLVALVSSLLAVGITPALAQASHQGDVALTYNWVHTNTQPGSCGCFGLNGGGVSASLGLSRHWSAVADIDAGHQSSGPLTGNSLTLLSYTGGARYAVPQRSSAHRSAFVPFAEVLVGGAHAGGGIAGAGDGTYAFALRAGGGVDLHLAQHLSVRLLQIDYYLTNFANTANNHQDNLLLGAGVAYRWSREARTPKPF